VQKQYFNKRSNLAGAAKLPGLAKMTTKVKGLLRGLRYISQIFGMSSFPLLKASIVSEQMILQLQYAFDISMQHSSNSAMSSPKILLAFSDCSYSNI